VSAADPTTRPGEPRVAPAQSLAATHHINSREGDHGTAHSVQEPFHQRVHEALNDQRLQGAVRVATERLSNGYGAAAAASDDFAALRHQAGEIRRRAIAELDSHLERFATAFERNGGHVYFARDAAAARRYVLDVAQRNGVRRVAKSKSMISEEIELNHALGAAGIEAVETDLGEYIVQQAGEMPSHIIIPALHKTVGQVADLFSSVVGRDLPPDPPQLMAAARVVLREQFLAADMGISGVNFAVADSGTLAIVSNEGNVDLCTTLPRIHVALMGMERLTPTWADLAVLLRVLPAAGTGQRITTYNTFITGPRRADEPDGPDEIHVVILDNGRADILSTEFADVLRCIRCGACLNVCPIYRNIGGHAYGTVYPGPIGAVLSPLLFGDAARELPYASSLCGACTEACPVGIPLHDLLIKHRQRDVAQGRAPASEGLAFRLLAQAWSHPGTFRWSTRMGGHLLRMLGGLPVVGQGAWISRLPGPGAGWTQQRDFPTPHGEPFHQRWSRLFGEQEQDLAAVAELEPTGAQPHPPTPGPGDAVPHVPEVGEPVHPAETGDPLPRPGAPEVGEPRPGPEQGEPRPAPGGAEGAEFLARVRDNLRRAPQPAHLPSGVHQTPPISGPAGAPDGPATPHQLAARFIVELEKVAGTAQVVASPEQAITAIVEQLVAQGVSTALLSDPVPLDTHQLEQALALRGITSLAWRDSPQALVTPATRSLLREVAAGAMAGVTGSVFGIADTGTIMVTSGAGVGRLPPLLPPCHVSVLRLSRVLPDLAAACHVLGQWGDAVRLPTGVVLQTGPSRSSDIAGQIVRGVHGPGRVHIVIMDDITDGPPVA